MLKHLKLARPLVVLDLETTGTDPARDRIVEISLLRVSPDGTSEHRTYRVNPGVPIPADSTAVHGITDEDVAGSLPFSLLAPEVIRFLDGCDLAGYNLLRFDLRLLAHELGRIGLAFSLEGRAILDPFRIFTKREPRDLTAAVRHYLGEEHAGAHGAEADVLATLAVLDAQLERYADLPRSAEGLHEAFSDPDAVDLERKFRWVDGRISFAFGKHNGRPLADVAETDAGYLRWLLGTDLLDDARAIVEAALASRQNTTHRRPRRFAESTIHKEVSR